MPSELREKKIAFLATNGVEQVELTEPWKAVEDAGGKPELISINAGQIQGVNGSAKADQFAVDATADTVSASDFDALVLPGGVANPDKLRMNEDAVRFVRGFFEEGKPVAAICHGPWMLVEAGVVRDRLLTSYPSLKTDIRNAGGDWVDREVVKDHRLVTSRNPRDLPAFCRTIVDVFSETLQPN